MKTTLIIIGVILIIVVLLYIFGKIATNESNTAISRQKKLIEQGNYAEAIYENLTENYINRKTQLQKDYLQKMDSLLEVARKKLKESGKNEAEEMAKIILRKAEEMGEVKLIEAIKITKPDANYVTPEGKTFLMVLIEKYKFDDPEIFKYCDIDLYATDKEGKDLLEYTKEANTLLIRQKIEKALNSDNLLNELNNLADSGKCAEVIYIFKQRNLKKKKLKPETVNIIESCESKASAQDFAKLLFEKTDNFSYRKIKNFIEDFNPDLNQKNEKGQTLAMYIIQNKGEFDTDFFAEHGTNFNLTDAEGNSFLHYAVNYTSYKVVEQIAKLQKNKDIINNKSETALMLACKQGDYNKVKTLLENGADPNVPLKDGKNIIQIVESDDTQTQLDIIALLIDYGVKTQ